MSQSQSAAADEAAIIRLIDRYSDALNHRDWDKVEPLFTPDAVWGTVNFREFSFKGARAIADGFKGIVGSAPFFVQMRSGTVVSVDGDNATARSTMHEVGDLGGGSFVCYGSYSDRLQRQGGVWRFAQRAFRYVYWQEGTLTGQSFPVDK
jgi:ketosteroid isomerase-like protein